MRMPTRSFFRTTQLNRCNIVHCARLCFCGFENNGDDNEGMQYFHFPGKLTSAEERVRNRLTTAEVSSPVPIERANIQRDAKGVPYSVNLLLQDVDSSFVKLLKVAFHEGVFMCTEFNVL